MLRPLSNPPDFSHVETWIFDLDNTLYSEASDLFALIDERMTNFVAERFGLDRVRARSLQKAYLHSHGTTLSGLMEVHGVEPTEFLDYVHEIDLTRISHDAALAGALARLPGRRLVYTNGSKRHAERVLEKLGIANQFDAVHDIAQAGYRPKPYREAYEALLSRYAIAPARAAMFEDIARNLEVPHALGMTTVLVTGGPAEFAHVHHTTGNLADFLASAHIMSYEQPAEARGEEGP
jgi:putative hydrolase of the HAD superfamily